MFSVVLVNGSHSVPRRTCLFCFTAENVAGFHRYVTQQFAEVPCSFRMRRITRVRLVGGWI
jgi:hypothetical protein